MQNDNSIFVINPAARAKLVLSSEISGNKRIESDIDVYLNTDTCKLIIDLLNLKNKSGNVPVPTKLIEPLVKLGLLVKKQQAPADILFKCTLDSNINKLIPLEITENLSIKNIISKFILNPSIFLTGKEIPDNLKSRIISDDRLSKEADLIWVEDSRTKILMPYCLSEKEKDLIVKLIGKKGELALVPVNILKQLILSGILIPSNHLKVKTDYYQTAKKNLLKKGYAVLSDVINPLQISALRNYYRALEQKGFFGENSPAEKKEPWHNEAMAAFIHHQLQYLVNQISSEKVKPADCYLSFYKPGAILKKYSAAQQSTWNILLVLDMEPELKKSETSPFFLEISGKQQELSLGIGDAVIYRGKKIPRWNNQLSEKQKILLCFFHFVV